MKTSTAIVETFPTVREMLAMMLELEGGYRVSASISSGLEALRYFKSNPPQLVVLELSVPEVSGLEILRSLRVNSPQTRVLIFTGSSDRELIFNALQLQPHGFVHKSESLASLKGALSIVKQGQICLSSMASDILDERRETLPSAWNDLNERERIVIQMVAEGWTSRDIATRLHVSSRTIESYRIKAMKRLGLQNIAAVTKYAIKQGLVAIETP